jgi:hypothetical protein
MLRRVRRHKHDGRSAGSARSLREARFIQHDVARVLVDSLKANGATFSVLLPDSVLHPVNELLLADADVQTVICSRRRTKASRLPPAPGGADAARR